MTNHDINSLTKNIGVELPKEDYRFPELTYAKRIIGAVILQDDGYYYRIDEYTCEDSKVWDCCEQLKIEDAKKAYPSYLS